jgi:competence protein ComEC
MQTMLLIAPLVGRENDPLTSLSAALAFLLLLNPFSAGNISLQLSFSAMLGIVLFADRIVETLMMLIGEGKLAQGMKYPIGLIGMSLSVMVFSLPVTAIHFGYVSAVSPLTNLLCL